jgi:hypothetical protein
VRTGDEVVVESFGYHFAGVQRVTETLIVTDAGRFRREAGHQLGGGLSKGILRFSAFAYTEAERRRFKQTIQAAMFNAASIRAVRTACDKAEAALRELGEWDE